MKIPQEISNKVLSMFLEGNSEEEIIDLSELSEDQAHNVLSELDSPECQNTLSYLLAVKYRKDGLDTSEYAEIIDAKKILVQQGVLPKVAIRFITNLAELFQTTGLVADQFVPPGAVYHKLTRSMSIKTFEELKRIQFQLLYSLHCFRVDEKELQERFRQLT
jgi:hypothetical protein